MKQGERTDNYVLKVVGFSSRWCTSLSVMPATSTPIMRGCGVCMPSTDLATIYDSAVDLSVCDGDHMGRTRGGRGGGQVEPTRMIHVISATERRKRPMFAVGSAHAVIDARFSIAET